MRDAYLQEFTDHAPLSALRQLAASACHVGTVCRALQWVREIRLMSAAQLREYDGAQVRWLMRSLVDEPLVAVGAD